MPKNKATTKSEKLRAHKKNKYKLYTAREYTEFFVLFSSLSSSSSCIGRAFSNVFVFVYTIICAQILSIMRSCFLILWSTVFDSQRVCVFDFRCFGQLWESAFVCLLSGCSPSFVSPRTSLCRRALMNICVYWAILAPLPQPSMCV